MSNDVYLLVDFIFAVLQSLFGVINANWLLRFSVFLGFVALGVSVIFRPSNHDKGD